MAIARSEVVFNSVEASGVSLHFAVRVMNCWTPINLDKIIKLNKGTVDRKRLIVMTAKKLGCITFSIALMVLCLGCKEKSKILNFGDSQVSVEITDLKKLKTNSPAVFANLEIRGIGKTLEKVNLNCIQIRINNQESKELYIDSVAHILTDGFKAKDNKIKTKVYWVVDENINENDLAQFEIIIRPTQDRRCFEYQ